MAEPPSSRLISVSLTVTPAVSSSATLTATEATATPAYPSAPLTAWLRMAASSTASSSVAARTLTVCAVCQLPGVKVRRAGCAVTSALSLAIAIATSPAGRPSRTTV